MFFPKNSPVLRCTIQYGKPEGDSIDSGNFASYSLFEKLKQGVKGVLRFDRKFRGHGPENSAFSKKRVGLNMYSELDIFIYDC